MSKSFQVKALAKSLLFQVFCSLSLGILLAPFLSNVTASFFYSVSCTIKDILVFFLPVVIFSYLVSSLIFYEKDATRIVGCVFLGVLLSIFMALGYAYGVGRFFLQDFVTAHSPVAVHSSENVQTLWPFPFQSFSTDRAMLFSLLFAFWINALQSSFLTRFRTSHYNKMDSASVPGNMLKGLFSLGLFAHPSHLAALKQSISKMKDVSEKALLALFIPIIPLYVFGFILKISKESLPGAFLKEFSHVFMLSFVAFIPFIMLAYFVAARFKGRTAGTFFKNMLPPIVTAFSTMSSVATLPLTLQAVEKNIPKSESFTRLVIPATVNVHAIGDIINIALSGLALSLMFGLGFPSFQAYALFAFYTAIAQFSCVSIPGGGIIVMTGILQKYLGLNAEAVSLLTSIYFLMEPFLTAANVTYTCPFVILLKRVLRIRS